MNGPRILHVNTSDSHGGAARAAYRLHEALLAVGIDSRIRVLDKGSDDPRVSRGPKRALWSSRLHRARLECHRRWLEWRNRKWKTANPVIHSFGAISEGLVDELNNCDADILNLHWISNMLSIADIGRLTKPLVWTIHDMWPFCGGEHYGPDDANARFRVGYFRHNRPAGEQGPDLNRRAWEAKRRAWAGQHFTIVGPSQWIVDCAQSSALMKDARVVAIPNPLNTSFPWRPIARETARDILGLPRNRRMVLTGALGGVRDIRKGGDLLFQAVAALAADGRDVDVVIFGQHAPADVSGLPCRIHWLGPVRDDRTMALAYSAADVMAVPSRQDNLCQTATEAQACGVPVVAFDIGGMPDIVEDGVTGRLSPPFDTQAFAAGLRWVLEDNALHQRLSRAARARAVAAWSPEVVARQYVEMYHEVLGVAEHPRVC